MMGFPARTRLTTKMRFLAKFNDPKKAGRFGDYLLTRGIPVDVEEDDGEYSIWVHDEDQIDEAGQILEDYENQPDAEHFVKAESKASSIRAQAEKENRQFNRRIKDGRTAFHRHRSYSAGPVTMFFVFACVAIFLVQMTSGRNGNPIIPSLAFSSEGRSLAEIFPGFQLWRLVTPALMHGDLFHIFFNCYWLVFLGGMIEDRINSRFTALFIVALAIISNFTQFALVGPNFLGFSGVNYGMFGFVWVMSRRDPLSGFAIPQSTVILLMAFFVIGWLGIFWQAVANWSHTGGLVAGVVAAQMRSRFFPS